MQKNLPYSNTHLTAVHCGMLDEMMKKRLRVPESKFVYEIQKINTVEKKTTKWQRLQVYWISLRPALNQFNTTVP